MRNLWDHFALVLYSAGIILFCLFIVSVKPENKDIPFIRKTILPSATPVPVMTPVESVPGILHKPEREVVHQYSFDYPDADPVSYKNGMLTVRDIASSRYYVEPSGEYEHIFREENGFYDCYFFGIGSVGDLAAYAKYLFRYDSRTGKAASFTQEQYIDSGPDMNTDQLAVYAENTGSLLEAVFFGTEVPLEADKRKIEELALYFFSSYIPENPAVPAVLHFRMPAYILSFIMDTDVFITMISPEKIPMDYVVENMTD